MALKGRVWKKRKTISTHSAWGAVQVHMGFAIIVNTGMAKVILIKAK
jgi:hypothetical protein